MKKGMLFAHVLLCALAISVAAQEKTGTLKGRIEDSKGKPIAKAEVRAMSSRTRQIKDVTTDESGAYSLELEPDNYTVSFDAQGFQGGTLVQMYQVEEAKTTTVKTIRLQQAQRSSLVRGAVFDVGGRSLAAAKVKLVRIPTEQDQKEGRGVESLTRDYIANSRGEFAFRVPSTRARYQVTATLSGYKPETKTVDVNEDESVAVAFSLEPIKK